MMTNLADPTGIPVQKKDSYYFSHDSNARNDPKIMRLLRELKAAGYGIFWMTIEILREQHDYRLALSAIPDVAFALHLEEDLLRSVIQDYDLFEIQDDWFFSNRLLRSMRQLNDRRQKLSAAGKRGNQVKHGFGPTSQTTVENQATATRPPGESHPTTLKESKVKESKVKETIRSLSASSEAGEKIKTAEGKYKLLVESLTGQAPNECWTSLKDFITTERPAFIEPYVESWNLFASRYGLPLVSKITDLRKKKFKARYSESAFNFFDILEKIKSSSHLKGESQGSWKVSLDWILENEAQYLKITEGVYS